MPFDRTTNSDLPMKASPVSFPFVFGSRAVLLSIVSKMLLLRDCGRACATRHTRECVLTPV